jgi:hypothetical protein
LGFLFLRAAAAILDRFDLTGKKAYVSESAFLEVSRQTATSATGSEVQPRWDAFFRVEPREVPTAAAFFCQRTTLSKVRVSLSLLESSA